MATRSPSARSTTIRSSPNATALSCICLVSITFWKEWSAALVSSPQKRHKLIALVHLDLFLAGGNSSLWSQVLMPCKADDTIFARMHDSSAWIFYLEMLCLHGEQHQLLWTLQDWWFLCRLPLYDWQLDSQEDKQALCQIHFGTECTTVILLFQPSLNRHGNPTRKTNIK